MNPTETLAAFITKTSWEDIPDEAVQKSKWPILDGIAVTFGGLPHEPLLLEDCAKDDANDGGHHHDQGAED